jgi:hypothetical protein
MYPIFWFRWILTKKLLQPFLNQVSKFKKFLCKSISTLHVATELELPKIVCRQFLACAPLFRALKLYCRHNHTPFYHCHTRSRHPAASLRTPVSLRDNASGSSFPTRQRFRQGWRGQALLVRELWDNGAGVPQRAGIGRVNTAGYELVCATAKEYRCNTLLLWNC